MHHHLAYDAAHRLSETLVFGKSGIGEKCVAAIGYTHRHGVLFAADDIWRNVDLKRYRAAHMRHGRRLRDSAVAFHGSAVDIDGHADIDAVEMQRDTFTLVGTRYVETLAIPHLAAPAAFAGRGVEEGVEFIEAVRYADFLPLAVVIARSAHHGVRHSDGRRHHLEFGQRASDAVALRVGQISDFHGGVSEPCVDRYGECRCHGALEKADRILYFSYIVLFYETEAVGKSDIAGA